MLDKVSIDSLLIARLKSPPGIKKYDIHYNS
jgi:hypothetical protein